MRYLLLEQALFGSSWDGNIPVRGRPRYFNQPALPPLGRRVLVRTGHRRVFTLLGLTPQHRTKCTPGAAPFGTDK